MSLGFGIYAPSGFATEPAAVDRAAERLRTFGHRVHVDEHATRRHTRFAGTDDERLAAVLRMAAHPEVDVAMAVRGGYGWTRLLDRLDFAAVEASGKRWLGHSDFTAFQLAALARTGLVTYAGPMAAYDFGATDPSAFTLGHCAQMLDHGSDEIAWEGDGPDVVAKGTLWGGNLTLLATLVGTAYLPAVAGGILFLEDVAEHPYRIERMLYQLHFAGILASQRAVLLGAFTEYALNANDGGYDFAAAIAQLRDIAGVPIVGGLPFGHIRDKVTLPVGGYARLDVRGGRARLAVSATPQ
jgi:muramoyltetrapeptide carboxypeptidase